MPRSKSRKILYSPGYGAGWSSWNDGYIAREMVEWKPIIEAIEAGQKMSEDHPLIIEMVKSLQDKYGKEHICVLGAADLKVETVNGPYRIKEYDGNESIETKSTVDWW